MKLFYISITILIITLVGCQTSNVDLGTDSDLEPKNEKPIASDDQCSSNLDCTKAGCSGEVCASKAEAERLFTTCVYKPEYTCYKDVICGCVNGKCHWPDTDDLSSCIENSKVQ